MRKLLVAAVIAGVAVASPFGGGAAYARPQHGDGGHHDGGGRPVIRFGADGGEREAHVANVPQFTRFVHPGWAARRPGWHERGPHRRFVGSPVNLLGWFLSALSR